MLTQLTTVKTRLALDPLDTTSDAMLTSAIGAISARFDLETNRTLARTVDFQQEFLIGASEFIARCYPIEYISKFEMKTSEATGWLEQLNVEYLIRRGCIVQFAKPLRTLQAVTCLRPVIARVTYTGGYLLPGFPPVPAATNLPADLEQAAIEQTVFWFQTRDKVGILRQWPQGGTYEQFADADLLPSVRATLENHRRVTI